jgi:signal transduction histidine kinase
MTNSLSPTGYAMHLQGGGEMGELTRAFDWASTSLGSPDKWPQSLLTTVSIILRSKFPMFLWWGPDLIQFYNDAYRPSLGVTGKHPKSLGQEGEKCWPEIWPIIKPLIDQVMNGGEATWNEDSLIPIYRNNRVEDVYWTFGYSPVINESGQPGGVLVICNETTDKVKTYNTISEAKKELEFAVEAGELATWDLNPFTNRFVGNSRLKEWFGLEANAEIELSRAIAIMAEEDRERVSTAIAQVLKKGSDGNYNIEYTINNPVTNIKRIVRAIGKVVFDAEGEAARFSGTLQDITEEYNIQLRKDEFISVASHELKTPITSLNASMQILQKLIKTESVSDKIRLFVGKAGNNLNKLVHLLDDLLNVTKLQQGQLALNKTRFNLGDLIKDSCEHLSQEDSYPIGISGEQDVMVYADYRRIDQVLVNLINNAIKYSPQSKKVNITYGRKNGMAVVYVQDYGIGINPDKLPHLFDRYYRVDGLGHQFSGLGLGLYISAEIIKRHDGDISVESEWGNGSVFSFTLPLD